MINLSAKYVLIKPVFVQGDKITCMDYTVDGVKRKVSLGKIHHPENEFCTFSPDANVIMDWRCLKDLLLMMRKIQEKLDERKVMLSRVELARVPGAKTRKVTVSFNDKLSSRRAGLVKWYIPAKEYCYYPNKDIVLTAKELREIFFLVKELNKEKTEMKKDG